MFQKTHLFKIWENSKMSFLGSRSVPSKEGLLLWNVQKPQKWGFGSSQNWPTTNGCSKKLIYLKFDRILKCNFWAEGVLLAKRVFYGKMFRNPENGGLGQNWHMTNGCSKKLIRLKFDKDIELCFWDRKSAVMRNYSSNVICNV